MVEEGRRRRRRFTEVVSWTISKVVGVSISLFVTQACKMQDLYLHVKLSSTSPKSKKEMPHRGFLGSDH